MNASPLSADPAPRPRRSLFKKLLIGAAVAVAGITLLLVCGVAFGLDWFLKRAITDQLQQSGMAEVEIGSLNVGILRPRLEIRDVKAFAQPRLGGVQVLDLPELFVEYDREGLKKSELRLKQVRIVLKELTFVDGIEEKPVSTMDMVRLFPTQMAEFTNRVSGLTNQVEIDRAEKLGNLRFVGIDRLELSVGKVRFVDMKDPTAERVANLAIQRKVWTRLAGKGDVIPILVDLAVRAVVGAHPVAGQAPAPPAGK